VLIWTSFLVLICGTRAYNLSTPFSYTLYSVDDRTINESRTVGGKGISKGDRPPQYYFVHHKSHMIYTGLNLGRRRWSLATNTDLNALSINAAKGRGQVRCLIPSVEFWERTKIEKKDLV
jgi:hypothetical protein